MKSLQYLSAFSLVLTSFVSITSASTKPNILLILVDDMGFSDIGCYGGEIPTPNIDRLAMNGLRFTQFYNTGRCCPTRASLLTGLYPHQAGIGHMNNDFGPEHPAYRGHLNEHCVTLGRVLSSAGYFTAASGKWHVGSQDKSMWPVQRGFERFYGCPQGGGFYQQVKPGRNIVLNNKTIADVNNPLPKDWYCTDAFTEYGLKFIDEAQEAEKPFFLYLAHIAPHFPLQTDPEDIAKYRGKYKVGWHHLRRARYQRQIDMGLIDPNWPLAPFDQDLKNWEQLTEKQKDTYDLRMAIYAAVMDRLDRSIGVLIDGLEERKILDNTLILFLSDNGACAEGGKYGTDGKNGTPGSIESYVYYGRAWANLGDTPFRLYKHYNHEGGIATPFIVHWPARIKAQGDYRHHPSHLIDIMPTLMDIAGATYPTQRNGKPTPPLPGHSLVPAFTNQPMTRPTPLYWEHEGNAAIRIANWKLVRRGFKGAWELYDLKEDRTELTNLAKQHPKRSVQMQAKWMKWAEENHVIPCPWQKKQ